MVVQVMPVVMGMCVGMVQRLVLVCMAVRFCQVQHHASHHQQCAQRRKQAYVALAQSNGYGTPDKWCK